MVWVKLDDNFLTNPKIEKAGLCGRALYVASLLYCSRELTDGFVHEKAVARLAFSADVPNPKRWGRVLVSLGLWEVEDGGYRVHDFMDYNPSRELVLKERAEARARMRRSREVRANISRTSPERSGELRVPRPGPDPVVVIPVTPVLKTLEEELVVAAPASPATVAQNGCAKKSPKTERNPNGLGPLIDAFRDLGLPDPPLTGPERQAGAALLKLGGAVDVARCWQAVAAGDYLAEWPQARSQLSFQLLLGYNRFHNWMTTTNGSRATATGGTDARRDTGAERRETGAQRIAAIRGSGLRAPATSSSWSGPKHV